MTVRFVTKQIHAYLDYPVAIALIGLPALLGLGSSSQWAFWLSVATGCAALLLTILTDHQTGVLRIIPYPVHLAVDFAVAIVFMTAPSLLGFTGLDAWFYWINATAVLIVVCLHKPESSQDIRAANI